MCRIYVNPGPGEPTDGDQRVHCTFNLMMLRFNLYLVSTLAVWFIAIRAALAHFGG